MRLKQTFHAFLVLSAFGCAHPEAPAADDGFRERLGNGCSSEFDCNKLEEEASRRRERLCSSSQAYTSCKAAHADLVSAHALANAALKLRLDTRQHEEEEHDRARLEAAQAAQGSPTQVAAHVPAQCDGREARAVAVTEAKRKRALMATYCKGGVSRVAQPLRTEDEAYVDSAGHLQIDPAPAPGAITITTPGSCSAATPADIKEFFRQYANAATPDEATAHRCREE